MSTENSPYLCLNYACHACIILKRRRGTIKRTVHASAEQYIDIVSLWWYVTIYRRFWILLYYNEVWVYKMFPGFKGCITKKWCHFVNLLDLTPLTTSPSWSSYPHYWHITLYLVSLWLIFCESTTSHPYNIVLIWIWCYLHIDLSWVDRPGISTATQVYLAFIFTCLREYLGDLHSSYTLCVLTITRALQINR